MAKVRFQGRTIDAPIMPAVDQDRSAELLAGVPETLRDRLRPVLALAPIVGLAIDDPSDVATWRVTYAASVTEDQRQTVRTFLHQLSPFVAPSVSTFWADAPTKIERDVAELQHRLGVRA